MRCGSPASRSAGPNPQQPNPHDRSMHHLALTSVESAGRGGDREHHIGWLSLSNAMMRRSQSADLEENLEPDQQHRQARLTNAIREPGGTSSNSKTITRRELEARVLDAIPRACYRLTALPHGRLRSTRSCWPPERLASVTERSLKQTYTRFDANRRSLPNRSPSFVERPAAEAVNKMPDDLQGSARRSKRPLPKRPPASIRPGHSSSTHPGTQQRLARCQRSHAPVGASMMRFSVISTSCARWCRRS